MSNKTKAVLYRFAAAFGAGFFLVLIPLLQKTVEAGPEAFDGRLFLWALAGGLVAGITFGVEKVFEPVLLAILADEGAVGPVLPVTSAPLHQVQESPAPMATASSSTGSETVGPAKAPIPPPEPVPEGPGPAA